MPNTKTDKKNSAPGEAIKQTAPGKKRCFPDVMSPEQAGEYLQVGDRTVYSMISNGEMPGMKIGNKVRILSLIHI